MRPSPEDTDWMSEIPEKSTEFAIVDPPQAIVDRALEEHGNALLGYATSILKDADLAKDVLQDTMVRLFRQEAGLVKPEALKSWLYTVCRNRSFDILRKEKRMTAIEIEHIDALPTERDDPREAAEREDRKSEVLRYLARLPENQREVLRLKFQHDLNYDQIAEITKLSKGNIGFLIHAGLKRLRQLMAHTETAAAATVG
ncbi:MAG: sigma-70 family RNA polymerase sigma factor [Verrucomicrobiota bacterium]